MTYAHVRYMKSLFTNIQKQQNMLKISLPLKEICTRQGQITREFEGLRMRNVQDIAFI